MEQKVKSILVGLGLSPQEVEIYLAVLALGQAGVSDIATHAGQKRTAAYFHIKNLLDKGLLRQTRSGRVFQFTALAPEELAVRFDRLLTDFKGLVPHLEALKKIESEKPIIEMTESKQGYFKIYDEISALPVGSTFRVMEGREALTEELRLLTDDQWQTFFRRIVERQITTQGLFTEESLNEPIPALTTESVRLLQKRRWDLRVLPRTVLPLEKLTFIYGSKVAFLFPETSLVMTIQHQGISDVITALFEALFHFAQRKEASFSNQ